MSSTSTSLRDKHFFYLQYADEMDRLCAENKRFRAALKEIAQGYEHERPGLMYIARRALKETGET